MSCLFTMLNHQNGKLRTFCLDKGYLGSRPVKPAPADGNTHTDSLNYHLRRKSWHGFKDSILTVE